MVKYCQSCQTGRAFMIRPKTGNLICQPCFFQAFEEEIHYTIVSCNMFKRGEKVAIAASGGKDSTVLAHIMTYLNHKYDYGLKLYLLSIDEGIQGYRDDSLETVKQNQETYQLELKILSYKELFNWSMDEIVKQIGLNNNCTYCGVFRRQALDRGAQLLNVDKIVTGHNADDMAETFLMNILRGDVFRLPKSTQIITGDEDNEILTIPRSKPFKYTYEKEIVMYAHYKKLIYFSTECTYSPNAYRGHVRELIKNLESIRPSAIIDIIHSAEQLALPNNVKLPQKQLCTKCNFISSNKICKACTLLESLNQGRAKLQLEYQ
ncbi:cytosolic thiouridylase subunit Ctu1 [Paramecium bursaria]